jgi:hypothetical protein
MASERSLDLLTDICMPVLCKCVWIVDSLPCHWLIVSLLLAASKPLKTGLVVLRIVFKLKKRQQR